MPLFKGPKLFPQASSTGRIPYLREKECWLEFTFKGVGVRFSPDSKLCQGKLEAWKHFQYHLWRSWTLAQSVGKVAQNDALRLHVLSASKTQEALENFFRHSVGKMHKKQEPRFCRQQGQRCVVTCSMEGLSPATRATAHVFISRWSHMYRQAILSAASYLI